MEPVLVCASAELEEGGRGCRFPVRSAWGLGTGFVVRYEGVLYAYLNQCAHVPVELDWQEGQFFDDSGLYLICATHGATYETNTGYCVMGPCRGKRLHKIDIEEKAGQVYWLPNENFKPI